MVICGHLCNDVLLTANFTRLNTVPASPLWNHFDYLTTCGCLQDEVNRVTGPKPYLESLSGQGSTEEQAEEAWQEPLQQPHSGAVDWTAADQDHLQLLPAPLPAL